VRLSRRRFWKSEDGDDKLSAYQTLYRCLEVVAQLAAPIAPFYMDLLFIDLNRVTGREVAPSVHLADFPEADEGWIDKDLEERMQMAQKISSMLLSLRKRTNIRVRQPLNRIMVPIDTPHFEEQMRRIEKLVLSEVNVKAIEYVKDTAGVLVKRAKPNFKSLGPRYGKLMKEIAGAVAGLGQHDIAAFEHQGVLRLVLDGQPVELGPGDLEVSTEDIPGWVVANEGSLTVALDIHIDEELYHEGLARELINRIQNLRKDQGFEVTDKIHIVLEVREELLPAVERNIDYICAETLAETLELVDNLEEEESRTIELTEELSTRIRVVKMQ